MAIALMILFSMTVATAVFILVEKRCDCCRSGRYLMVGVVVWVCRCFEGGYMWFGWLGEGLSWRFGGRA